MLLLQPYQADDGRTAKAFNPLPPKNPDASPRYACGACEHVLLTGMPLVELKQRLTQSAGTDDVAVRCPACRFLNATKVGATKRVPRADTPPPGGVAGEAHPWNVSRVRR